MNQSMPQINTGLYLMLGLVAYIVFALPLYTMGTKTGSKNAWWAFVPILQTFLLIEIAGKEWWWFLLLFVPCINIVVAIMLWMAAAEAMNKPSWLGILMLLPVANIIIPFYLAYG